MYVSGFCLYVIDHDRRRRYTCPILQANLPLSGDHISVPNAHGREFIPEVSEEAIFQVRQLDTDSFDVELYHQPISTSELSNLELIQEVESLVSLTSVFEATLPVLQELRKRLV